MGIIYIVTSPSGKSYVGQTRYDIKSRWRDHIYDATDPKKDHCKLLNRAIRKYGGDNFEFKILCECDDCELNYKEEEYIKMYNTLKPNGYNLKEGGSTSKHLEETKQKISEKLKGIPKPIEVLEKRSNTKKKGSGLPMYIIESRRKGGVNGYRVTHPKFPEKCFTSPMVSLADNLKLAMEHLEKCNITLRPQFND